MLGYVDRKRIHQEEVYRYDVKTRLGKTEQNNNKAGGGIWTFLNSAFFLWFLSSVVIGIISFSYAKWDKQRELEREQRERSALVEQENTQRVRKLDAEVSSRLTYFFYSQDIDGFITETFVSDEREATKQEDGSHVRDDSNVEDGSAHSADKYNISFHVSEDGIRSLNNPSASDYKSGDPEYANRSLRSLLVELEAVVPVQEKSEISLVLDRFIEVQPLFIRKMKMIKDSKKKGKLGSVKIDDEIFNKFCSSVEIKRWGIIIPVEREIVEEIIK